MKVLKIALLGLMAFGLTASFCFAAGDVEKGKALFNDTKLSGGTSGKSCNSCHPGGKGLEGVGDKKEWQTPGGKHKTLEEAVNTCITMALKGKALDAKSQDMANIIAYMKTIKAKPAAEKPAKKKKIEGC